MYNKKKCMKCGQPATHKFTRIEKGQIYDIFLCSDHAAEMSPYQKPKIPLSDIMEGLLKPEGKKSGGPEAPPSLRCPNCGLTFAAYRKNLLLGCSECYNSFREFLIPDLRRFHGNTRHYGRRPGGELNQPGDRDFALVDLEAESAGIVPKGQLPPAQLPEPASADPETQLEELTRIMHRAIAEEDYQRAASCRDQIRELKAKIKKTASG